MNEAPQHAPERESRDDIGPLTDFFQRRSTTRAEPGVDKAWQKFNALCLDGGGIRGLWSLKVLQKLMEKIGEEEEKDEHFEEEDDRVFHSFCPRPWPDELSAVHLTDEEKRRVEEAGDNAELKVREFSKARRYLPCHYFDFICGSSTGSLIAIMLGRLRMTVTDCILEYKTLGSKIFGKPRYFVELKFGMGSRCRYDHKVAEEVFKDVVKRRTEKRSGETYQQRITFPSGRGLCNTFVTTEKSEESGTRTASSIYLLRSYDHEELTSPENSTRPLRRNNSSRVPTDMSSTSGFKTLPLRSQTNYGHAQDLEIWQVARAATAADFFFKPLKLPKEDDSGYVRLTDGGFGGNNNPAEQAKDEIEDLHGQNSINIMVSVGTARKNKEETNQGFFRLPGRMRRWADQMSDPERVHRKMYKQSEREDFVYHRFNHPNSLEIDLDEWKPRRNGSTTIATIEQNFSNYLNMEGVDAQFKSCAESLVACRRSRMNTREWERYATVARYTCSYKGCNLSEFFNCNDFQEHLREKHHAQGGKLKSESDKRRKRWEYQASRAVGS